MNKYVNIKINRIKLNNTQANIYYNCFIYKLLDL